MNKKVEEWPRELMIVPTKGEEEEGEKARYLSPSRYFDLEYVNKRNALIPGAVAFANSEVPVRGSSSASRKDSWNRIFHARMNELAEWYRIKE